ncbi:MAG TPA: diacylglycerol kinase family lipid kinase [Opitutaceae bacterium]|nr:diacylglycerol kinase family lipid kinase [Opitutaceae bacterium]
MKFRFILNPRSGRNLGNNRLLDRTRAFIARYALDATVVLTERPRHATELARQAVVDGCERVVAIGGDGTLNEVAAALIDSSAVLGLVPCGSGNGFGRHLGIKDDGPNAYRTLLSGRVRAVDTGVANGHPFVNVMGVGFDAEISRRFNRLTKRGFAAYLHTTVRLYLGYRRENYCVQGGGASFRGKAFLIAVANSDQYGNDCYIAPGASVSDGQLDLTVIRRADLLQSLPLAYRLFRGTVRQCDSVVCLRNPIFTIERDQPGPIHTDGEVHETVARVDIEVRPASLNVLIPSP